MRNTGSSPDFYRLTTPRGSSLIMKLSGEMDLATTRRHHPSSTPIAPAPPALGFVPAIASRG
jgi:hypothetical protein